MKVLGGGACQHLTRLPCLPLSIKTLLLSCLSPVILYGFFHKHGLYFINVSIF